MIDEETKITDSKAREIAIRKAPEVIQKVYALQKAGIVQKLDSLGIEINGTFYGSGRNSKEIPIPSDGIELPDGSRIKVVSEYGLQKNNVYSDEDAVSAGFDECTAVIWEKDGEAYFVHNSNSPPSNNLRAHVITFNNPDMSIEDFGAVRQGVWNKEDEAILASKIFDRVVIIGRSPDEIAKYFENSTNNLEIHKVSEKDGVQKGKKFNVWISNKNKKIAWGIIPED